MKMPFRHIVLGTFSALALLAALPMDSEARPRYGWHRHGAYPAGSAVAAAVIGGLALGALTASAYPYGPAYPRGCGWRNQATYDAWGRFVGYQPVRVCD